MSSPETAGALQMEGTDSACLGGERTSSSPRGQKKCHLPFKTKIRSILHVNNQYNLNSSLSLWKESSNTVTPGLFSNHFCWICSATPGRCPLEESHTTYTGSRDSLCPSSPDFFQTCPTPSRPGLMLHWAFRASSI